MPNIVYANGEKTVNIPASGKLAVFSYGEVAIYKSVGYPNIPSSKNLVAEIASGRYVSSTFSTATEVVIKAGAAYVEYEVGTAAIVKSQQAQVYQGSVSVLDVTGALTASAIYSGIVTSTTAAAVTGTLPTGAVMELSSSFDVNTALDWSVINTGPNAFTVAAAASGHTVTGNMVVAAGKAARFRTRKNATDSFVTYALANT